MIINQIVLLAAAPIKEMYGTKIAEHGVTHGLGEVGYDIRLRQSIHFTHRNVSTRNGVQFQMCSSIDDELSIGRFALASSIEEFDMPDDLMGVVHDKSTWARQGLSVFNTVIEPGWKGFLTLELVYHGEQPLTLPAGAGIAQVVFHKTAMPASYDGKYQNQADQPVAAIMPKL